MCPCRLGGFAEPHASISATACPIHAQGNAALAQNLEVMTNPHPTDTTERERELGFEHIQIENETAIFGEPPLFTVVARKIGPSSYVFKCMSEDGGIYYKHHNRSMTIHDKTGARDRIFCARFELGECR